MDSDLGRYYSLKLAGIYEEALGDLEHAAVRYRKALDLGGEEATTLAALDRIYKRQGKWADLAEVLNREAAAAVTPDDQASFVEFAKESGYFNVATLREPYRVEGNKTLAIELAEQFDWNLPDVVVYPTGGGEGVIGMWKAFEEMREWNWTSAATPRIVVAQADGCAPIVKALEEGADRATPWPNPTTHAAGLRVPGPLGDRLVLRAIRETNGDAGSASEDAIRAATSMIASKTGIDAAPEGGCGLAVLAELVRQGRVDQSSQVVLYNTGSGASYRQ
jgi:threonine synthase